MPQRLDDLDPDGRAGREEAEVVLVGFVLGPAEWAPPPIATALTIEGILRPGD